MARRSCFVIVTLFAATLTLAASTSALAQSDPAAILKRHVDAIARGDAVGALSLYAGDAVIDVQGPGSLCSAAPCVGKAAIQKELERRVAVNQAVTIVKTYVSGNLVTYRAELRHDLVRKAGVERTITWGIYEMKGDKISYVLTGIPERADSQTARYLEWQRAQAPTR